MSKLMAMLSMGILLAACGGMPAGGPSNAASAQEARAEVERVMQAIATMDREGFRAGLDEDILAFEQQMQGEPRRMASRDEVVQYIDGTMDQAEQLGATFGVDIHGIDCSAAGTLAYCTAEFDFQVILADGATQSHQTRNTVVLRREADGWKWVHWHASPGAAAASPSP